MAGPQGWNEFAELRRRLERVEPVVTEVAVMKAEMRNLTHELTKNTAATNHVAEQLESAQMEPLTRGRQKRDALIIALSAAAVGGGLAILGVVISHV